MIALSAWAHRHTVLLAGSIGACCAIMAWLRLPAVARDTLWAEDGRNFLQAALRQGPIGPLFHVYSGYLHTIPRIISSLIVQFVPVPMYAYAMTAATCIAAGGAASVVYVCSRDVVPWLPGRVAIAAVTVLGPLEPREVLGNAANLHSIMFWMLFWMMLYRPRSRSGSIGFGVIALLAALTEIQSLFLLPLLWWGLRDRRRWPLRASVLFGAAIQLFVTLAWPRGTNGNPAVGLPSIVYGYLINSVVPLWIPQKSIGPSMVAGGVVLAAALAIPVLAAAIFALVRGTKLQRVAVVALIVGSVTVYAVSVIDNPHSYYDYASFTRSQMESVWLTRYGVVPSMMLIAVILVAISTRKRAALPPRGESGDVRRRVPHLALLGVVAVLLLIQFPPQPTRRSAGPVWLPQVDSRAETCQAVPDSTRIALNETLGWKVRIKCGVLEKYG